jgi:hypothetical protein
MVEFGVDKPHLDIVPQGDPKQTRKVHVDEIFFAFLASTSREQVHLR